MYHNLNAVLAGSDLLCQKCATEDYATIANMRRVVKAIRKIERNGDHNLPHELRRTETRYNGGVWDTVKVHRTWADAVEYAFWHSLLTTDGGETITGIDDYNNVWEDHYPSHCEQCSAELPLTVLHTDPDELDTYGLEHCLCEDCTPRPVSE